MNEPGSRMDPHPVNYSIDAKGIVTIVDICYYYGWWITSLLEITLVDFYLKIFLWNQQPLALLLDILNFKLNRVVYSV